MTNSHSKYKILVGIVALLLITNISMLVYFVSPCTSTHHAPWGKSDFENALKDKVGFSEDQLQKFRNLKETYWANAKKQMEQVKQVKLTMFHLTKKNDVAASEVEQLADSIATLQKQIEINYFHHFKGTREICTPQQQPAYDTLMTKIVTRMGHGGGKPAGKLKK